MPTNDIMPSILIAIVDDDVDSILSLRDYLENEKMSTECFADAEALLGAHPCRFDAILLDINLPGIYGSECSYRLRCIEYKGPIIAISGSIELWDTDDLKELGFTCILSKPLNPIQLITLLRKHITGWRQTNEQVKPY
jgi:CheY-like chemotaxis protein